MSPAAAVTPEKAPDTDICGEFWKTSEYLQHVLACSQMLQAPQLFAGPMPQNIGEPILTGSLDRGATDQHHWLEKLQLVFKPHAYHSVASSQNNSPSLENYLLQHYDNQQLPPEGGLLQRLDYLTAGLLLQTSDGEAYSQLKNLQKKGCIRKFYAAWSPVWVEEAELPLCQEYLNYFRPYGPKGREVRIVGAGRNRQGTVGPYLTRIERAYSIRINSFGGNPIGSFQGSFFALSLDKGFRHQLRAQLGYLGFPLANDPIYNQVYHPQGRPQGNVQGRPQVAVAAKLVPEAGCWQLGLVACGLEIQLPDITVRVFIS